jgi:hypothetical protein
MTALGIAVPKIMRLDDNWQIVIATFFLVISIGIGILIMSRSRFSLSEYGFRKSEKNAFRKVGWYIPLLALEILPIVLIGFESEVTVLQYIILLFFTTAVGFNEEIYFRGLILKLIREKGIKKAIIWSSVIFGILHLANSLNGKNALYLILQVMFAFLVGIVLAEVVCITKSLWAVIIWHAVHDYIATITSDTLDTLALIVLAIQVGILLVYSICIWKRSSADNAATP